MTDAYFTDYELEMKYGKIFRNAIKYAMEH